MGHGHNGGFEVNNTTLLSMEAQRAAHYAFELKEARAEIAALHARLQEAARAIEELRAITGTSGAYAFARQDGTKLGMYDQIIIGDVLEKLEAAAWLAVSKSGEIISTTVW